MADKVFTMTTSSVAPSKNGDVVTVANGGSGGTSVIVTIGDGLTIAQADERLRAFNRAWRRRTSKTRTVAGIATGATNE